MGWAVGPKSTWSESDFLEKDKFRIEQQKGHMECKHRILYLCADQDRMTNLDELEGLVSRRSDQGHNAKIEVIRGADHPMTGHEEEVAVKIVDWIKQEY